MRKPFLIATLATVQLFLVWLPAGAIDWTVKREPGLISGQELVRITGAGEIVPGDADRLRLKLEGMGTTNAADGPHPTVYLDSPGGDVVEGINIGWVIRNFDLGTFVAGEAGCYSACTFAFLGGTDRRVLGEFGIHAMSSALPLGSGGSASEDTRLRKLLDTLQGVSAYLVSYTREMTGGSSRMAEEALKFGSAGISRLDDSALRDWQIVTYAARPSQRYAAESGLLSKCNDTDWLGENVVPRFILCDDLVVSRQYIEITGALANLKGRPLAADIEAEQSRWDRYWEACEASIALPTWIWHRLIENCVREAFDLRSRELTALVEYYGVGAAEPAKSGWRRAE